MSRFCKLLPILGLLIPNLGIADTYVAKADGGDYVKLLDTPCQMVKGWLKMNAGQFKFKGKVYDACWFVLGTVVIVVDETGDVTPVEIRRFSKEESI